MIEKNTYSTSHCRTLSVNARQLPSTEEIVGLTWQQDRAGILTYEHRLFFKPFELWGHRQCPHKPRSYCNTSVIYHYTNLCPCKPTETVYWCLHWWTRVPGLWWCLRAEGWIPLVQRCPSRHWLEQHCLLPPRCWQSWLWVHLSEREPKVITDMDKVSNALHRVTVTVDFYWFHTKVKLIKWPQSVWSRTWIST